MKKEEISNLKSGNDEMLLNMVVSDKEVEPI